MPEICFSGGVDPYLNVYIQNITLYFEDEDSFQNHGSISLFNQLKNVGVQVF